MTALTHSWSPVLRAVCTPVTVCAVRFTDSWWTHWDTADKKELVSTTTSDKCERGVWCFQVLLCSMKQGVHRALALDSLQVPYGAQQQKQ
ncbi:unnamed protein product [Pleuronectes platessa]|uniref:Secreted protein n=1 Tax=Pleuronectes platessa TaxID=8262 RepID=A0A9N7YRF0_PLEPL|nr:unnamed protein product [Pleuronectes platessa]